MNNEKITTKEFLKARIEFDDTVDDVAEKFGYSRTYIYDCLRFPNRNPELYQKIADYVDSALKFEKATI